MAREIQIYERIDPTASTDGFCRCVFLYETEFERGGMKHPITPKDDLAENLQVLFTGQELSKFDNTSTR